MAEEMDILRAYMFEDELVNNYAEFYEDFLKKGGLKKAVQKVKAKVVKPVAEKLKTVAKKVAKGAAGVSMVAALAPLTPLVPMMRTILKKKKITPKKKLKDLAEQFFNEVVKKKGNYEHYETLAASENFVDAIAAIVKGILQFIKDLKEKKKAGQATAEDEEIIDETEKSIIDFDDEGFDADDTSGKKAPNKKKKVDSDGDGDDSEGGLFGMDSKTLMILAAIVAAIILIIVLK